MVVLGVDTFDTDRLEIKYTKRIVFILYRVV